MFYIHLDLKKNLKHGKDENQFLDLLGVLANGEVLDEKYRNHKLINDKE